MDFIASNLGVFASTGPVAIDRACLDMLQTKEDKPYFEVGRESLAHAEKLGLGSQDYDLIPLEI